VKVTLHYKRKDIAAVIEKTEVRKHEGDFEVLETKKVGGRFRSSGERR